MLILKHKEECREPVPNKMVSKQAFQGDHSLKCQLIFSSASQVFYLSVGVWGGGEWSSEKLSII